MLMGDWRTAQERELARMAELLDTRYSSGRASDFSWRSGQSLEHNTSQGPFFFGTTPQPQPRPRQPTELSEGVIHDDEFQQPQQEHWESVQARRIVRHIAENVVGTHSTVDTPFGPRALSYADFAATSRPLRCIEDFLRLQAMPLYGSVQASASATGLQTAKYRDEAREIVTNAVNARVSGRGAHDCVLFTGEGSSGAVAKLVLALGLQSGKRSHRASKRPVVFTDPFACHSSLLPWIESVVVDVVAIPEAPDGSGLDLRELERQLELHARRPLKIGAFSAGSSLTGVLADVDAVSTLLHRHEALACWDYAACAPYVAIDMNPPASGAYKDAVFFSGHRFIGGPGSPGVLVLKKRLLTNAVTMRPGRTVAFVTEQSHIYLSDRLVKEEGEASELLGSLRLALAMKLKQRVGVKHIRELERHHAQHIRYSLARNNHIVLLGQPGREIVEDDRLPVFSFLVRLGERFLHYHFVCALLNDLFGVQTSGGAHDAGPHATKLLGIARHDALALDHALKHERKEVLRPGFTRVSFPYFMDAAEANYVLAAVNFVATHGWKFLPQYDFDCDSGVWQHFLRADMAFPGLKSLSDFSEEDAGIIAGNRVSLPPDVEGRDLAAHRRANLGLAAMLADQSIETAAAPTTFSSVSSYCSGVETLTETDDELRWFVYPSEAVASWRQLRRKPPLATEILGPCQPQRYWSGALQNQWDGTLYASRKPRSTGFLSSVRRFVHSAQPWHEEEVSQEELEHAPRKKQRGKQPWDVQSDGE